MGLSKPYLLLYNLVQACGWGYILYLELLSSARSGDVGYFLQIFQTLALLEVFHACFRLVRSSPLTTIIQLSSRIFVVWAVLYLYPEVFHSKVFKMMVLTFYDSLPYWNTCEFIFIFLIMYLPFSPVMYKHMLAQRRKVLGSPTRKNV
ncbi:unnamed protein product [Schistocephalus solidus]|uniref:Very-long-chain (3R)-3-hydroxyacyl-CoA dehydratase n=1 Tax=Schistocephalus solidus TaxID=70667 RepID=A0A183SM32_SCHSO|nr:unnamed protein product [Schistocephalus solidus]